jgi:hypothetical protein
VKTGQGASNALPFFVGNQTHNKEQPMQRPPIKGKLSLEWVILANGCPALAFDKPTWAIYEQVATERGQSAQHMIAASVAAAFGQIIADNYAANRRQDSMDAIMTNDLQQPIDKDMICIKLVELIRRAAEHGIDIEALIYEALAIADAEPP